MEQISSKATSERQPPVLSKIAAAVVLGLGLAASAGATTINGGLVSGVLNTLEDQDREAYVDVNGDGLISIGDVFIGVVRIDNFKPKNLPSSNQVYGVISNQITGFSAFGADQLVTLGVTTAAGLSLPELTGNPNTAGGLVAVYDRAGSFTQDLITSPTAADMLAYISLVTGEGTLRVTAGLGTAADTYLHAYVLPTFGVGASNDIFTLAPVSLEFGDFGGGLDVLYNNTNFIYTDSVLTLDKATGFHTTQVGIAKGTFGGMLGDGNEAQFGSVPGYTQCTASGKAVTCGFVTDADFYVAPISVPEPGSLTLLGAALIGLTGLRRCIAKA